MLAGMGRKPLFALGARRVAAAVCAAALVWTAQAYYETVNGITWTYAITSGGNARIVNGSSAAASPKPEGALTIPATLGGKTVTEIGPYALYKCTGITSVRIPDAVTLIDQYAFYGCTSLSSVTFKLPNGVMGIGKGAFAKCTSLGSVSLPYSITSLGDYAFQDCTALKATRIPVRYIDRNISSAFTNCPNARIWFCGTEVQSSRTWHYQVCNLGNGKFYTELRNINSSIAAVSPLPGSGTLSIPSTIGGRTLNGLGLDAFWSCSSMTGVEIPSVVTNIDAYAFGNCSALKTVKIPNTVGQLGTRVFYACVNLESVTISSKVPSLPGYLFYKCGKLTRVSVPDSVTSIADNAFMSCSGLKCVDLPEQFVDKITKTSKAFTNCPSDLQVLYRDKVGGMTWYFFVADNGKAIIENNGGVAVSPKPTSSATLTIPSKLGGKSVVAIGSSAFKGCGGIKRVNMSSGFESLAAYAFDGCSNLDTVNFPNTLKSIGSYAFRGTALTSITVPSSVTAILPYAFANCSKLATARLPLLLYQVDPLVFYNCPASLKVIYPCVVTFNANGGSGGATKEYNFNSQLGTLPTPSRSGYKFEAWYTAASGGSKISTTTKVIGNVTYYAHWLLNASANYTLTCNPSGGKLNGGNFGSDNGKATTHNLTVSYGKGSYNALGTATRDGYTFTGWYTATSGGTQVFGANGKYVAGTYWNASGQWVYSGNLTVYAQWKKNSTTPPATGPGTLTMTLDPVTAGGKMKVTVTRTGGSTGRVAVKIKTQDSSTVNGINGRAGIDFRYLKDFLVWNNGDTSTKVVYVQTYVTDKNSTVTFRMKISALTTGDYAGCATPKLASDGKVIATITPAKNPKKGTIVFSAPDPMVTTAGEPLKVTIRRIGGSDGRVTVKFKTQDSSTVGGINGLVGIDFQYVKEFLEWDHGDASDKTLTIPTYQVIGAVYPRTFRLKVSVMTDGDYIGCVTPELDSNGKVIATILPNPTYPGAVVVTRVDSVKNDFVEGWSDEAPFAGLVGDNLHVVISRLGGDYGRIAVKVETLDATMVSGINAVAGKDFQYATETFVWADGQSDDKELVIQTRRLLKTYPRTFILKLTAQTTGGFEGFNTPGLPSSEVIIGLLKTFPVE